MYAFITHSEESKLNLWSRFSFLGPVEHFQNLTNSAQLSVIIMNSTKYIFKALLLLIEVLGFDLNMVNFLRSQGLHALSERFLAEEIEVEQIARLPTRTWSRLAWPPSAGGWGFVLLLPTGRQHWWVVLFFHFCKWSCFTFLAVKWMQNNCHTFCRIAMCTSKWRMLLQLPAPTRFYKFFQVYC